MRKWRLPEMRISWESWCAWIRHTSSGTTILFSTTMRWRWRHRLSTWNRERQQCCHGRRHFVRLRFHHRLAGEHAADYIFHRTGRGGGGIALELRPLFFQEPGFCVQTKFLGAETQITIAAIAKRAELTFSFDGMSTNAGIRSDSVKLRF